MNYFQFYDIPISFEIDEGALKKTFLINSKKYHPDFFTLASDKEQEEALRLSTLNNEAYKILGNFGSRIKYILQLKGALEEEGKNTLPQDFLMEMMDINEVIMDLQMDYDPDQKADVIKKIDSFEHDLIVSIEDDISSFKDQPDFDFSSIKNFYLKRKYLKRIKDNLDQIDPEV